MNLKLMKIACLSILLAGSGLQAMGVERERDVERNNQEILDEQLRTAILSFNPNIQQIEQLISNGADINAQGTNGYTALIGAVLYGHKEICELLIAHSADVNAQDAYGRTALIWAALRGHKEICELLIAHSANVNAQDKDGYTALMIAAERSRKEICELLIANGANVNAQDDLGYTALIKAALQRHKEICKLLIRAMIKLTKQERSELTTLLSLKKRNIPSLHTESQKLITKTRLDDMKLEKRRNVQEQIMKIKNEALRSELLGYLNSL